MSARACAILAGALLAVPAACRDASSSSRPTSFPDANLIVISLDTLRADGLESGGGPDGISPVLDAFAREAVVFEHARAPAPHTAPSHMSLFTSLYPSVHGVQNVAHGVDPRTGKNGPIIHPLPERFPTLAQVLQDRGFTTIGLTDGGNVNPAHGFPRGFDAYTHDLSGVEAQLADAEAWLADRTRPLGAGGEAAQLAGSVDGIAFDDDAPAGRFFLFWHTYEIHAPYVPPDDYVARWAPADYDGKMRPVIEELAGLTFKEKWGRMKVQFWKERDTFGDDEARYLRGLYHGGIEYTDTTLARLFDALRREGLFESSIVVLLSDHGEEFYEHGGWQHEQLYEECLRVPLMIRLPGGVGGGRRVATPVSLIDVMPTVLELLGIDAEAVAGLRMQGRSLARVVLGGPEPPPVPVVSELRADHPGNPQHDWMVAHYNDGLKFVYDEYRGERKGHRFHHLYDLAADPLERSDLVAAGQTGRVADFMLMHARWKAQVQHAVEGVETQSGDIDAATLEQLEELGYIQTGAVGAGGGTPPGGEPGPAAPGPR